MSKFLKIMGVVLLLVCACFVETVGATSENSPVYSSEQAAIAAKLKELRESKAVPGTYLIPVSFERDGRVLESEARVTITGEYTVVTGSVAIDANSVEVSTQDASLFSDADWIRVTGARAWRTDTGADMIIDVVDASQVQAKLGTYAITFGADQAKTTTIIRVGNIGASSFYDETGYFENNLGAFSMWNGFEFQAYAILELSFIFMLLIPLIILVIQYMYTSKMVKRLIQLVMKK